MADNKKVVIPGEEHPWLGGSTWDRVTLHGTKAGRMKFKLPNCVLDVTINEMDSTPEYWYISLHFIGTSYNFHNELSDFLEGYIRDCKPVGTVGIAPNPYYRNTDINFTFIHRKLIGITFDLILNRLDKSYGMTEIPIDSESQ